MALFNLKTARIRAGLKQVEIAQKLGMKSSSYSQYENYRQIFKIDKAVEFSNFVGIPIEQITFFGTQDEYTSAMRKQDIVRKAYIEQITF